MVGRGTIAGLADLVRGDDVWLVTDDLIAGLPMFDRVRAGLGPHRWTATTRGEPNTDTVEDLAAQVGEATTLVAIGGGSVIDAAKLAATGSDITQLLSGAEPGPGTRVVAVPTTAGTGAEVTCTAVVSVGHTKTWVWHDSLRPSAVVIDGDLTLGLPPLATAASAIDAAVHAIEAATSAANHDGAVAHGLAALTSMRSAMPAVLDRPTDLAGRAEMLEASTAAGLAIDLGATGVAHGLGHALGSLVPVPHGLAVGLALWKAAEFNAETGDPRCELVAEALGARGYVEAVKWVTETAGFERRMARFRSGRLDSGRLAEMAGTPQNRPMCLNNVRVPDVAELRELARSMADWWNGS